MAVEEERLWLEIVAIAVFGFLKQNFFKLTLWILGICIVYVMFTKLTRPVIHPYYKTMLRFEKLLLEMKAELEKGIPTDKRDDPKILKAYLEMYATFRELRGAAKRDHNGKIDHRTKKWRPFDRIKLPERKLSATV